MTTVTAGQRIRLLDYPDPPLDGLVPGPNARQALAHRLGPHCDEVLFGGARGGGKTDFAIAEALRRCTLVPGLQAVIFRRTYRELTGPSSIHQRLLARIPKAVARWRASDKEWRFSNGSSLFLSYLESLEDVQSWLGLELQLMVFDQLEQLDFATYQLVRTSLRASGDLAGRLAAAGYRPSSIATANPGGVGHAWVKSRFVDPYPTGEGQCFRAAPTEGEPTPMVRVFVKSLLSDNPALDLGDPTYRSRLEALDPVDRAAYLEGDWNVFKGARFASFRTALHVIDPETMPIPVGVGIARARGIDYGSENPFVCLWGARLADDLIVVYREISATGLSPAEQARLVRASEPEITAGREIPAAIDPSTFAANPDHPKPTRMPGAVGGRHEPPPAGSIAWHYAAAGLPVRRGDNRRIEGAALVADRLKPRPDGSVRLKIYSTCRDLIRTLPSLQRDPRRPEDVLKADIDHWYDALRYLLGELGVGTPEPAGTAGGDAAAAIAAQARLAQAAAGRGGLPPATSLPADLRRPPAGPGGIRRRGF